MDAGGVMLRDWESPPADTEKSYAARRALSLPRQLGQAPDSKCETAPVTVVCIRPHPAATVRGGPDERRAGNDRQSQYEAHCTEKQRLERQPRRQQPRQCGVRLAPDAGQPRRQQPRH